MSGWEVASQPSTAHGDWIARTNGLFSSPGWARAVAALGGETKYAWSAERDAGVSIAVFRRAAWRVGILGFPVASEASAAAMRPDLRAGIAALARASAVDLVRLNLSMATSHDAAAVAERPEAWIADLRDWDPVRSRRLRKDLAFAQRACAGYRWGEPDPLQCHALHAGTLAARGARARYGANYFRVLGDIARRDPRLQWVGAHASDGSLRGFAVLGVDGDTGYYLHGGADAEGRRAGVSDLLLERLVRAARDAGALRFTLMASPWDQPGLLAFKRKWSEKEGVATTHDVGVGMAGLFGVALARWQSRADRRAARRFFAGGAG